MSKSRWSPEIMKAHVERWRASDLTSDEYVARWAPEVPARTLRHYEQVFLAEREVELLKLRDENAALKAKFAEVDPCRPATSAQVDEMCLAPEAIAARTPEAACHPATAGPSEGVAPKQQEPPASCAKTAGGNFFSDWDLPEP